MTQDYGTLNRSRRITGSLVEGARFGKSVAQVKGDPDNSPHLVSPDRGCNDICTKSLECPFEACIYESGKGGRPRVERGPTGAEARDSEIVALYKDMSASAIAVQLGVDRATVAGALYRKFGGAA